MPDESDQTASHLVQEVTSDTDKTHIAARFNDLDSSGKAPLVLVPRKRSWYQFLRYIPADDAFVLMQRYGRHHPEGSISYSGSGTQLLHPFSRMVFLVTRSATIFQSVLRNIPTSDDIKVQEINLKVTFTITKPKEFAYGLGVLRFNEYLGAVMNEGVRMLVRSTPHDKVLDMMGELSTSLLEKLATTFGHLGVHFVNVTIPHVSLPTSLLKMLENIQSFESKTLQLKKQQDFDIKSMTDTANYKLQEDTQTNEILEQNLRALKKQTIQDQTQAYDYQSEKDDLAYRKAAQEAEVKQKHTFTSNHKATMHSEELSHTKIQTVTAQTSALQASADQKAKALIMSAEAEYSERCDEIAGNLLKARSEAKAAESFTNKRLHELELRRLRVLSTLARTGKIVLRGQSGNSLLDDIANCDLILMNGSADRKLLKS